MRRKNCYEIMCSDCSEIIEIDVTHFPIELLIDVFRYKFESLQEKTEELCRETNNEKNALQEKNKEELINEIISANEKNIQIAEELLKIKEENIRIYKINKEKECRNEYLERKNKALNFDNIKLYRKIIKLEEKGN